MIDPAGGVPAGARINAVAAVTQRKQKGVERVFGVDGMLASCCGVGNARPPVFDDAHAARHVGNGKDTLAMDGTASDLDQAGHECRNVCGEADSSIAFPFLIIATVLRLRCGLDIVLPKSRAIRPLAR
ncbi:hypothetical protein OKW27_007368 [Paraburkholderia sp. 35.1]